MFRFHQPLGVIWIATSLGGSLACPRCSQQSAALASSPVRQHRCYLRTLCSLGSNRSSHFDCRAAQWRAPTSRWQSWAAASSDAASGFFLGGGRGCGCWCFKLSLWTNWSAEQTKLFRKVEKFNRIEATWKNVRLLACWQIWQQNTHCCCLFIISLSFSVMCLYLSI